MKNTQKFRKTKKGILTNIYHHQRRRSRVDYSLKRLHDKFLNDRKFNRLYKEWVKKNFNKQFKPSIDRISCKKHYFIENIHCLTWAENRFKQTMERRCRKGKVYQMIGQKIIKIYKSQRDAVRKTGLSQSQMSKVLNKKGFTCGGYIWEYEQPELVEE